MRRKIIIVDDHPLVLSALTKVISYSYPDIEALVAVSAAEMRIELEKNATADEKSEVVLAFVDLNLPDANGEDVLQELRFQYGIPVIAISSDASPEKIMVCIRNGASGFVEKTSKMTIFPAAVNAVLSGGQYFPTSWITSKPLLLRQNPSAYLTPRQREVLDLLIAGKANKLIAATLGLTEGTVKNHVGALLQTFEVESRSQLILATNRIGYKPKQIGAGAKKPGMAPKQAKEK